MAPTSADIPEFAPQWSDPSDAALPWLRDVMHNPYPVSPLNATLDQPAFSEGATRAIRRLSMPIDGVRTTVHHGHVYLSAVPAEVTPELIAEMQRLTMELGATVLQDWRETFEPAVQKICDDFTAFNPTGRSVAETAQSVTGFYDQRVELFDIHMRVNIPPMNAVFGFEDFLEQVAGPDAVVRSRMLLQGFDNKSVETGQAIWDLSRWVREDESLVAAVKSARVEGSAVQVADHARAAEFQERFGSFLNTYGWRSDSFFELETPSWQEEPGTPLSQLKNFLAKDDSTNPYLAHQRQAKELDPLAAAMESALPEEARPTFRAFLPLVQQYIPIAEDHNFVIDQKATIALRYGIQKLGSKLVEEGSLAVVDDVFFLELSEIHDLADGRVASDLQDRVAARRSVQAAQMLMDAPLALGTPPPPDAPPDPLVEKFFGVGMESSEDARMLRGRGASPGVVTGTVKVVRNLGEAEKVEEGDIMVCPMTMPAWTPLFGVVGAVVADSGGVLSHCAIVAREYGIPCVTGTQRGTRALRDGMRVSVDGAKGTVEVLS